MARCPEPGLRLRQGDMGQSIVGLFILGFAVFWCLAAFQGGGFFWVFGLLPLSAGLYLTVLRYFTEAHGRKNTYYGVTDQRIRLMEPKQIQTLFYDQIPCLELEPGKNGEGCIYLSDRYVSTVRKGRHTMSQNMNRKGLYHIQDAARVFGIIQQQKNLRQ